jgi:hypothetical protein
MLTYFKIFCPDREQLGFDKDRSHVIVPFGNTHNERNRPMSNESKSLPVHKTGEAAMDEVAKTIDEATDFSDFDEHTELDAPLAEPIAVTMNWDGTRSDA